jgi:hypothetical protein
MSETKYFAAQESRQTAENILHKANVWYNELYNNGYLSKVREMWMAYHGAYYTSVNGAHRIVFGGEQGELTHLAVNHLRNIAQHILQMITANRPSFQARATNSDYKSLVQTKLANQLLDYYMREKRVERHLHQAVEYAIVLGSGYLKIDWNATSGEIYDTNDETGTPIYEGDAEFCVLSPYDVVFDTTKESSNHDWVVCRSFKNKFDFAAKYPEFEDKIKGLQTKSDLFKFRMEMYAYDETADVAVYEFYHKKTESMPDGRYMLFLDKDIVLLDTALPYRTLPVHRISPSDILGTPYGYTPMFDLLPIQDAVNSLYSTVLTNQHAFGVQNIYVPRGADVSMRSLSGGLNIIEGNAGAGKPESMNLTNTPKEVFDFLQMLESKMETISGVNSVARGSPEASLKTGAALALVQSMALQFISGLQQQYIELVEDVGTGLVNMLKDFAAVPRIAMIAGKANRSYIATEFTGDDLSQVNRVIVDMGNPISRTTAGKMEMASQLIQYGIVKTPEQYMNVLVTGQLDTITDDVQKELLLIEDENERLSSGEQVMALAIDEHIKHIKGHRGILSTADMRKDQQLTATVLYHINEHITLLRQTDPALLQIIGEQPLGPAGGSPPGPEQSDMNAGQPPQPPGQPQNNGDLPNMPNMPSVPSNVLSNPEAQQAALGNVK